MSCKDFLNTVVPLANNTVLYTYKFNMLNILTAKTKNILSTKDKQKIE